ncbi:hypothetical protein XELAEV_18013020mg, partial [Xenopus laevis]
QALRYNRICSYIDDRNKHLHSLQKTFVNQEYQKNSQRPATNAPYRYRLKQIFPELPLLSYRQPPNLRKIIVRSALPKTTKTGTFPCNRCETCKCILCKDAIPNTQKVNTILDHYSCASSNVVYVISCTWCSTGGIYIGETGQKLCTRMCRHKINTKSCDPVWQHFYRQNHSLQDMQVLILKGNFKTERERKIYEFKCMELKQGLNLGSGFMSHYVT